MKEGGAERLPEADARRDDDDDGWGRQRSFAVHFCARGD
jgi:hypothetical protein